MPYRQGYDWDEWTEDYNGHHYDDTAYRTSQVVAQQVSGGVSDYAPGWDGQPSTFDT